jgi:PAS domain S-box-containing protein
MVSMPPDAITVLLVSEQAEEVKLITKSLRSFYPGCRVEVVYSPEEALEWASKQDWHIIILDELLLDPHVSETLQQVRRRAPRSALIVAAARQDTAGALHLMRQGADYCLFKNTPTFLTELPIVTREVLEKRDLRARLDLAQDRYLRLIDNLTDIAYELDAEGRFLYVSPAVQPLLHYDPQELIGLHYSTLIPPDEVEAAERRFNERRSESRATRRFKLRLVDKDPGLPLLSVEINATALYDRHRQFVGTVGIARPTVGRQHMQALQRLSDLPTPLTLILTNTEQLLQTVQDLCEQVGLAPPEHGTSLRSSQTAADESSAGLSSGPSGQADQDVGEAPPSFEERRRFPRIEIAMEARATSNGRSWDGTALNISLGGIFILFKGEVSAGEQQMTRLGFGSDVGVLEIPGIVRHIRVGHGEPSLSKTALTGLAIQFSPLKEMEGKILQSLVEGLRTRSISMKFTAFLIRQPTDPEQLAHIVDTTDPSDIKAAGLTERRQTARVNLDIPARIERPSDTLSVPDHASITNLSAGGACLRLDASPDLLGQRLIIRFSPPPDSLPPAVVHDEHAEDRQYRLTGEVMWLKPDDGAAPRVHRPDHIPLRIGIRFVHDSSVQNDVTALLSRYLTADRLQRSGQASAVSTEFLECTNEQGMRLAVCHDYPSADLPPADPLIILVPGYGRTKTAYIELAYYFACNGCRVLRYDHGHHVGESDGGMVLTTLTGMQEDLNTVIDYAARLWPASPRVIVASDVAARVALKTAAHGSVPTLLVLLAPVLDLQYTLMTAHQEDLIAASLQGAKRGISNVLGFNIDADAWLSDAIQGAYADFQTTRLDVAQIRIPVLVFASEQDLWVRPNSFPQVKAALREAELGWQAMPEARHGVVDHPDQARVLFRQIVAHCRARLYPLAKEDVTAPAEGDLVHQARLELERARIHHQMGQSASVEFWRDYLDRSHSLVNFSEYWHVLDHIHRLLGPLDNNARVLDAGCGNGNFGMFLLIAASFRQERVFGESDRLHYLGVDLVSSGLEQAKSNLIRVAAELRGKFAAAVRPQSVMKAGLACVDLNASLPFQDGQFDRVVCNLVLGYLRDPLFTLRELVRVLAPHGKLVLTNFKPQADVSHIYRNFVSLAKGEHERQLAEETEEASATITQRSREGAFRSFDRQELAMLLISSGASQPRVYSTFANQAYIAVAEKPSFPLHQS